MQESKLNMRLYQQPTWKRVRAVVSKTMKIARSFIQAHLLSSRSIGCLELDSCLKEGNRGIQREGFFKKTDRKPKLSVHLSSSNTWKIGKVWGESTSLWDQPAARGARASLGPKEKPERANKYKETCGAIGMMIGGMGRLMARAQ